MAGTRYVQVSREDLEAWLGGLPFKWSRKQGRQGIYYAHFSSEVGCSISTTIGRDDAAVGKARGSMSLTLVSLSTGRTLNRKAKDRKHFQRTTNWRTTWAKGIDHWHGIYKTNKGWYDRIAPIEDRAKYKADSMARIEAIKGWETQNILVSFHASLKRDSVLSQSQWNIVMEAEYRQADQEEDYDSEAAESEQEAWLARWVDTARAVYRAARSRSHQFGMGISESVGKAMSSGRDPSKKQWRAFLNVADQLGVPYDLKDVPKSLMAP